MDNLAHGLAGAVIGYCGFRQRGGRAALWAAITAAEFPDIDIVMGFLGGQTYLRWHRSFTHSAVLLPFWAALVAWVFWEFSGRKNFRLLWMASVAGIASHLFMDWATNYGTELLWPVGDTRFALSWVFIIDVYVWALLLIAVIAAIWTQRVRVAQTGLAIVGAYFLFCGVSRAVALHGQPRGAVAYPQPLNPVRWTIVWAEGDRIHWINGAHNETFMQFHDDQLLPKAEATEPVKLFRWFAAFPLVEKIERKSMIGERLTYLRYRDLRFRTPMPDGQVREGAFVVAKVVFDESGNVIAAGLGGVPERR